jgi:hypothetical protein
MQELNVQPSNPTPYTPAGGTYNFNPTPGAGGLPALSGLNNRVNPMARELQQQGRGEDTMLVHMTPDEVNDLQGLALHSGTTMTINPNTGLPEAGLLGNVFKKLLPSLIGAGLMFIPGVNAVAAAGIVGGGSTLLTGSLKKGLMAGLGAYGGASLARGLGAGVASAAKQAATAGATTGTGIGSGAGTGISATKDAVGITSKFAGGFGGTPGVSAFAPGASGTGLTSAVNAVNTAGSAAKTGLAALPGNFAKAAQAGLPGGIIGKAAPMLAGSGLINTVSGVDQAIQQRGGSKGPEDQNTWKYEGPYRPQERIYNPRPTGFGGQGEINFFEDTNPYPGYLTATGALPSNLPAGAMPTGYADGGDVSKMSHEDLISKGYGGSQLQAGTTPEMAGSVASLGGQQFIVNAQGRWEPYGAPTTETVQVKETIKNTIPNTGLAALPASEALRAINPEPNKLSNAYQQNKLGATLAADMPRYAEMYQSSPGAITAPLQYPGGTFNEQVRAQMAAQKQTQPQPQPQTQPMYGAAASSPYPGGMSNEQMRTPMAARGREQAYSFNRSPEQPRTVQDYMADYYRRYGTTPTGFGDIPPSDMSYAKGGVHMDDGAFVVDARTVSELGNGSSNAGIEFLERLGGHAVRGPGDGVSDSVPAKIGGTQEARVARDEVIFPAKAVKRLGGSKKLYALMDKAHKARKKADRGEDTKLRKGLGAL